MNPEYKNQYADILVKKPIVIFSASCAGLRILNILKKYGIFPSFFCDNSPKKQNSSIMGYQIISVKRLVEIYGADGCNIIIATKVYHMTIFRQLIKWKISENCIYNYEIEHFILYGVKKDPVEINYLILREYQKIMLDIMSAVHSLCEEHNLTYYLYAGTLLGAIRHNGFIPWDDDLDIIMPRKDYEKLFQILKTGKPEKIIITEPYKNLFGDNPFFQISRQSEMFDENIHIDIFPLDKVKKKFYINKFYLQEYVNLIIVNAIKYKNNCALKDNIIIRLLANLNIDLLIKISFFVCDYHNNTKTKFYYIFSYIPGGVEKNTIDIPLYDKKELHQFEGRRFWIPSAWNEILIKKFGEYMVLPSEELRY